MNWSTHSQDYSAVIASRVEVVTRQTLKVGAIVRNQHPALINCIGLVVPHHFDLFDQLLV